ncbi:hypothetical protein VPH35_006977 [Triticum aestivum]
MVNFYRMLILRCLCLFLFTYLEHLVYSSLSSVQATKRYRKLEFKFIKSDPGNHISTTYLFKLEVVLLELTMRLLKLLLWTGNEKIVATAWTCQIPKILTLMYRNILLIFTLEI